jgi:glycosyltransferase involved in cell wall biosynthesis
MKILMASTSYPRNAGDWQGRFIFEMSASIARCPNVDLETWAPPGELAPGVIDASNASDAAWLARLAEQGGIAHLLRTAPLRAAWAGTGLLYRLHSALGRNMADVAHINWLQNALALAGSRTPAVITVLGSDFGLLRKSGMTAALRAVLRRRRCLIAPNAGWMVPELERRFGDLAGVEAVHFGVNRDWFAVKRSSHAVAKRAWLVVSRITPAKLGHLLEWGEGLFDADRTLHLFGPMQERIDLPTWIQYHGPTGPAALSREWFPQATGLLTLSRHDEGRPQVMIEAMAAGLPVIATDLPAHRDLLTTGETGMLVGTRDEFEAALELLEREEGNYRIGENARTWVRERIGTWDDTATRFVSAYRKVLGAA